MALRVLLADESSTIKKVMQLALQDFAVEVRSVPNGLDVPTAVRDFRPDIIFVDVLLTKKSGYEVCQTLKSHSEYQNIPVVLMWSSFMDLDSQRFEESRADGRLEKPFDADTLRSVVNQLVPGTGDNPLSAFLKFPNLPDFQDPPGGTYSVDAELNKADEFSQVPLHTSHKNFKPSNLNDVEDAWSQQDLAKFRIDIDSQPERQDDRHSPSVEFDEISERPLVSQRASGLPPNDETNLLTRTDRMPLTEPEKADDKENDFSIENQIGNEGDLVGFEELNFNEYSQLTQNMGEQPKLTESQISQNLNLRHGLTAATGTSTLVDGESILSNAGITEERLIFESQKIIESICWKILPDIAEKVIREELARIMETIDREG